MIFSTSVEVQTRVCTLIASSALKVMVLCLPAAVTVLCSAGANTDCNYIMVLVCRLRQVCFLLVAKYLFLSVGFSLMKPAVF